MLSRVRFLSIVAIVLSLAACTGGSSDTHRIRASHSAAAERAASTYLTALRAWTGSTAATVRGLDFSKHMVVGPTETTKQQAALQSACDKAATVRPAPSLAAASTATPGYAHAQAAARAVAAPAAATTKDLAQYRAACTRYLQAITRGREGDRLYRAFRAKFTYTKTTDYRGQTWTCHVSWCRTPDTSKYTAMAAAYGAMYRNYLAGAAAMGSAPPFPGEPWAVLWRDFVAARQQTAKSLDAYLAAVRSYQGKSALAESGKGNRIDKAADEWNKFDADWASNMRGAIGSGDFPASVGTGVRKLGYSSIVVYCLKWQLGRLEGDLGTQSAALVAIH